MISIIMPTYNRFEIVQETIQKIISLSDTILFELIVVNDGNELPFTIHHQLVTILKNPTRGAAGARNYGALNAKYDILFFIDDDMWITEDTLKAIKKLYDDSFLNTKCVVLNWQYPEILVSEMKSNKIGRYLLNSNYHTLQGRSKYKIDYTSELIKIDGIGSGSFIISKKIFSTLGGYNDDFIFQGEDVDLTNKLYNIGVEIFLFTKITCFHNQKDRLDIKGFLDRDYRGFLSQFKRKDVKSANMKLNKTKKFIFTLLMPFESLFVFIFKYLPNKNIFDFFTFRIIGVLSSISYFKALNYARNE